jgi:carboxymethylenebutenolidase
MNISLRNVRYSLYVALAMLASIGGCGSDRPVTSQPLPPDRLQTNAQLEHSSRHGQWVQVAATGGPINCWLVYPERSGKAPVVVVIHEIYGMTDWVRAITDELAREGFVAIAPDLLSGRGPDNGDSASVSRDEARQLISQLDPQTVNMRLDVVRAYAMGLPAARSRSGVVGFCWGGSTAWRYAAHQPDLDAVVVFYGTAMEDSAALASIDAPVLGLYGGEDARVTQTVDATAEGMQEYGHPFQYEVYEGAGHAFLRVQEGHAGANLRATVKAWPRAVGFLRKHLER